MISLECAHSVLVQHNTNHRPAQNPMVIFVEQISKVFFPFQLLSLFLFACFSFQNAIAIKICCTINYLFLASFFLLLFFSFFRIEYSFFPHQTTTKRKFQFLFFRNSQKSNESVANSTKMSNSQSFSNNKSHQCCSGHQNGRHRVHPHACNII